MWGVSTEEVKLLNKLDPGVQWHPTNSSYLSVRISNTKADQMSAFHSLGCHKSQFNPDDMKKLASVVEGRRWLSEFAPHLWSAPSSLVKQLKRNETE
jgi:hypothetical protein